MKVHIGEFDAESYWSSKLDAKLPSYVCEQSKVMVDSMDELLFGFTDLKDVLITKKPFDIELRSYLTSLGFDFITAMESEYWKGLEILKNRRWELEPFAVTECVANSYSRYPFLDKLPDINIVKRVNSKEFSAKLALQMECNPSKSYIVKSISDIEKVFSELKDREIIIKEFFGVSGKGSLILRNNISKKSILKYLRKQSQLGMKIGFIIEEFLKKKLDFSTHIYIEKNGRIRFLSESMMSNSDLVYRGSSKLFDRRKSELKKMGYFEIIYEIGCYLYKQGYWGAVGIDSMFLDSGKIVPLVEINARKSMGLLHYSLEKKLNIEGNSHLSYFNLKVPSFVEIRDIINMLYKNKILYNKGKQGIMPLSGNLLKLNERKDSDFYKNGRLYFLAVSEKRGEQIENFKKILREAAITVY